MASLADCPVAAPSLRYRVIFGPDSNVFPFLPLSLSALFVISPYNFTALQRVPAFSFAVDGIPLFLPVSDYSRFLFLPFGHPSCFFVVLGPFPLGDIAFELGDFASGLCLADNVDQLRSFFRCSRSLVDVATQSEFAYARDLRTDVLLAAYVIYSRPSPPVRVHRFRGRRASSRSFWLPFFSFPFPFSPG